MAQAIINQFDGGQAEDVRTFAVNQHDSSFNFNIYDNPHYLQPYVDMVTETISAGTLTDYKITDVAVILFAGNANFVALGRQSSGSNSPTFFVKNSSSDITAAWVLKATGVNNVVSGSLVAYKDFAYCLGDTGAATNLQKYDSNVTVSTIGTLGGYDTSPAKPFVHPEDNVMYMGSGNIISSYDPGRGTPFNATALTLPSNKIITSLTNYGSYLAIVCKPKNGQGNSTCYLWGRDTTLNTLQGTLDLGIGQVNIIENLGNLLIFVMTKGTVGGYTSVLNNMLTIKGYQGGAVEVIKEVALSSSLGTAVNNFKQKRNDQLFFAFSGDTAIYRFGKNKAGSYFLSHDMAYPSGATTLNGFSIIGDFMWINFNTLGVSNNFYRTSTASSYATTSTYVTTINPSMILSHRYNLKLMQVVAISFTNNSSGTVNLKVSYDGGAYTTLISSTATGEQVIEADSNNTDSTPFSEFREVQFKIESTGNVKIKEVRYIYRLQNSQLSVIQDQIGM